MLCTINILEVNLLAMHYVCVCKFSSFSSSWPSANPKRMTLSRRLTSKKFRTSRAKKVTCLRCGACNDQESWRHEKSTTLKFNMEPKNHQLKRKIIFQTSIFGFHVNFPGCMLPLNNLKFLPKNGLHNPNLSYHAIVKYQKEMLHSFWASHVFGAGGNGRVSYSELVFLKSRNTIGSALPPGFNQYILDDQIQIHWFSCIYSCCFCWWIPQHFHTTWSHQVWSPRKWSIKFNDPNIQKACFFFFFFDGLIPCGFPVGATKPFAALAQELATNDSSTFICRGHDF